MLLSYRYNIIRRQKFAHAVVLSPQALLVDIYHKILFSNYVLLRTVMCLEYSTVVLVPTENISYSVRSAQEML